MKYCHYCGTELHLGAVSFCHECGAVLSEQNSEGTPEPFIVRKDPEPVMPRRQVDWNIPFKEKKKASKTSYDGYYDDIMPEDGMSHENAKVDNTQIQKIGLIIAGVIVIAVLCIVMLILL